MDYQINSNQKFLKSLTKKKINTDTRILIKITITKIII